MNYVGSEYLASQCLGRFINEKKNCKTRKQKLNRFFCVCVAMSGMVDLTHPISHMTYTQVPAVSEKNILLFIPFDSR